jgi:S1-C subfamily serine protease
MSRDLNPEVAEEAGVRETKGILVADILPDGPAEKSGLRKNDVIVAFNGKEIDSQSLRLAVSSMTPGSIVDLKVLRNGSERNYMVTLGTMPTDSQRVDENQSYPTPRRRRG